jgi:hypothetical protein
MAAADVMAITKWSIEFHTRLAMRITKMATMAEISIRGAKPADIPVAQPDQVGFVINLTTAKARPRDSRVVSVARRRGDRVREGASKLARSAGASPAQVRP